jgi:hypothetical protein
LNLDLLLPIGQPKLRHGEQEIRFESTEPFPLYPGEQMEGVVQPLQFVEYEQIREFFLIISEPTLHSD